MSSSFFLSLEPRLRSKMTKAPAALRVCLTEQQTHENNERGFKENTVFVPLDFGVERIIRSLLHVLSLSLCQPKLPSRSTRSSPSTYRAPLIIELQSLESIPLSHQESSSAGFTRGLGLAVTQHRRFTVAINSLLCVLDRSCKYVRHKLRKIKDFVQTKRLLPGSLCKY